MYRFDSRIRYSEVDENDRLTFVSLVNYFQDCSTFQSEDLGLGLKYLRARDEAWVVNFWQIIFDRAPQLGDHVQIGTRPHALKGFMGQRNFYMLDEQGNYLARANSVWSLINLKSNRLSSISDEMYEKYVLGEKIEMEYASRKVPRAEGGEAMEPIPVQHHHLDSNHHVNNGQYINLAMAYLPADFSIHELRIEYRQQAYLGDMIYPVRAVNADGSCLVELNDAGGKPYALALFM